MKLKAFAKINLGLDVIGRREDGYHQVRMIMQTIRMFDQLEIEKSSTPGIRLSVNLPYVPTDSGNLVYRAASLLMEEFSIQEGVDIRLNKFIPVAAGMAGGSSDAAAALVGVNRLFDLGLSRKELMERGLRLGADVPYCVMKGTRAGGGNRGEADPAACAAVLLYSHREAGHQRFHKVCVHESEAGRAHGTSGYRRNHRSAGKPGSWGRNRENGKCAGKRDDTPLSGH
mgnify:CR=1 FL=1